MTGFASLPRPGTSFVGREHAVKQVCGLLSQDDVRLLTLIGPAGAGKTRLAIQAATLLGHRFDDGIHYVPLAALSESTQVPAAIAQALGVVERSDRSLAAGLRAFVHSRKLLLVLDNFEHLVAAAPQLTELLAAAPQLNMLVTSRAVLHLSGEHIVPVPPLSLPDSQQRSVHEAMTFDAVRLFVTRAQAARPDFILTDANLEAVTAICRRLDGLPLAIELAATRAKLLSPTALLAVLDRRLPILTVGASDWPSRHQTLRDALAWSYDLLDAGEQELFRRLAVFVGGCTLEAVEAVIGRMPSAAREREPAGSGPHVDPLATPTTIVEGLQSLLDKSLLRQEHSGGTPRFSMLETVREYAWEQLEPSGEVTELRLRHLRYILQLAETAEAQLTGRHQQAWLRLMTREYDNVRAALAWSLGPGSAVAAADGLRLVSALWPLWWARSELREGRAWLEAALAVASAVRKALSGSQHSESPASGTETALLAARAKALHGAGTLALAQGDYTAAHAHYEASLKLARQLEERLTMATALHGLGRVAESTGAYAEARSCYQESLALFHALADSRGIAGTLSGMGRVASAQAEYEVSRWFHEESLALVRALGDPRSVAASLVHLGVVATEQSDYATAATLLDESLTLSHTAGDSFAIAEALEGLAGLASAVGAAVRAAQLFGAAEALRESIGAPLSPADRPRYERRLAATRTGLDAATFSAAHLAGSSMPLDAALALALDALPAASAAGRPARHAVPAGPTAGSSNAAAAAELTPGERVVLRLVARGLSNKDVAAQLHLSPFTVQNRLRSIFGKLGVSSRSAATRYAMTHRHLAED